MGRSRGPRSASHQHHLRHHRSYRSLVRNKHILKLIEDNSLPVGFFPAVKPSGGASASICAGVGVPDVDGAGGGAAAGECEGEGDGAGDEDDDEDEGITGGGGELPALIAGTCAWKVVETMGQPFPGPSRFCSVSLAVLKRASCDAFELSWGKDTKTVGLVVTCPAATFAFSFCHKCGKNRKLNE